MPTIFETVNADAPATSFGHRWGWLLALGIVQIIAGGIAIAVPVVASLAAVAVFGAVLVVTAILQIAPRIQGEGVATLCMVWAWRIACTHSPGCS